MKKILLASVALVLASCGDKAPYEGTYEGKFPCADCDGINVSLTIGKDTYTSEEVMNELTDEELEEGMLFNEPADVADIIIQSK